MKKFYKTFTFYFLIIGLIVILFNASGMDDMNIFLIGFNPILNLMDDSKIICDFMNSSSYLWYIASLITDILYGLSLDFIVLKIKKV